MFIIGKPVVNVVCYRPITSLGHQERRRFVWEGPKFFELCPIISNYNQHIFPGEAKNFLGGLRPWLRAWCVMNVVCYEWACYELIFYELVSYELVCY